MARKALIAPVIVFAVCTAAIPVFPQAANTTAAPAGQGTQAAKLWEDFIHYSRIARLDLAASSGKAFVALNLSPEALLGVIESGPYEDWELDLVRLQRMDETIASVGKEVEQAIDKARIAVSRDPQRVRQAIEKLDDGARPRINATRRLQAAGQYAAPELLKALLSRSEVNQKLNPYIIEAMVAVGKPIVPALSQALPDLPPVNQQQIAEVLSRVGYPIALPYLRDAAEREGISVETKNALILAFNNIAALSRVPTNISAEDLYLKLADDYYSKAEGLMLEPDAATNLMWQYGTETGLTSIDIPTPIFYDVQAMRAARRALQLRPSKSAAYSLWVSANLRRENNLPEGAEDPSYSAKLRSPMFYAELAGPAHVHPILQRAMVDRDAELALDAIAALAATAGANNAVSNSLLKHESDIQPLISALNYPDRRVRYQAAHAIAKAKPTEAFPASSRVVSVLADAIREEGKLYALIIADNIEQMNARASSVKAAGQFTVLQGSTVEDSISQINTVPGIDMIVVETSALRADKILARIKSHHKLQGAPVVLMLEGGAVTRAQRLLKDDPLVTALSIETDPAQIVNAFKAINDANNGGKLTKEQALDFSLQSLHVLRDLAVNKAEDSIFSILDVKPTLLDALNDSRKEVVLATADVLALLSPQDVQQAVADAALQTSRGASMQVELLKAVALSARLNDNQLSSRQIELLLKLIADSTGNLADAAASAYGSLNLPTERGVELITQ